jgi:hypothetical protein
MHLPVRAFSAPLESASALVLPGGPASFPAPPPPTHILRSSSSLSKPYRPIGMFARRTLDCTQLTLAGVPVGRNSSYHHCVRIQKGERPPTGASNRLLGRCWGGRITWDQVFKTSLGNSQIASHTHKKTPDLPTL